MIIDKLTVYSENLNFELRILNVLLPIQIFFIKLNLMYAFCYMPTFTSNDIHSLNHFDNF